MTSAFILPTLTNCLGNLLTGWVANPVKAQFDYVCHYQSNCKKFIEEKDELSGALERLRSKIQMEENNLAEIGPDVERLISGAEQTEEDMRSLQDEIEIQENQKCFNLCPNWWSRYQSLPDEIEIQENHNCFNPCPNWWSRYRLSRKLEYKIREIRSKIDKLDSYCQKPQVGKPIAPPSNEEFLRSSDNFHPSNASKKASEEIRSALLDDNVSMIGLCGMGGVGKTTLVVEVGNDALKSMGFEKVVQVTISQNPNFETIQDKIAKELKFDMNDEKGRRKEAKDLCLRLKNEKRILIILDDIWAKIDIKTKLGIPVGEDSKACKVALTTRRKSVCVKMDCKIIELGCLEHEEALELFEKKAGLQSCNNEYIKTVAVDIVKECQGLPIALVALGGVLKGEESIEVWEAAYTKIKKHKLMDIDGIQSIEEKNAYHCLVTSFDFLNNRATQMCFLLCSLFSEDDEIYVEDLVRYAGGLVLYEDAPTIKEVRVYVLAAINTLKDSCLLLDAGASYVKMHDLVRDVALWISKSNYQNISFKIKSEVIETWPTDELQSYTAISVMIANEKVKLPTDLACPNLKFLLLGGEIFKRVTIPREFFEGMQALKVCSLYDCDISMDAFDQFPTDLRSLHFNRCRLPNVSVLRKLKKVEILSFEGCDIIEIPDEIGELDNLKILDLSKCQYLRRIPPHLLRRLSRLEELYLGGCTKLRWTNDKNTTEEVLNLCELSSLSDSIKVLTLEVSAEHVPKDFVFPELDWFDIKIVSDPFYPFFMELITVHSQDQDP